MQIKDRVWGTHTIDEPVLLDLINTKPVQRLKQIRQMGALNFSLPAKHHNITRYEHTIGVVLFLRQLGASLKEQIAGLSHDTPHTAFSHTVDWVFPSDEHDYHEHHFERILEASSIPTILNNYGIDYKEILDEHNFPLLEQPRPDLCADRIDYGLRDALTYSKAGTSILQFTDKFTIHDNKIVMTDEESAIKFAYDYLLADKEIWSYPKHVGLYYVLAQAIRLGLDNRIITRDDLFTTDDTLLSKLKQSNNASINDRLSLLTPKFSITLDERDYDFHQSAKLRYIDPPFLDSSGTLRRVSEVDPDFNRIIDAHKKSIAKGYYIKINR
tara:strand:+ start:7 stop:987 length:981 start_codon:yes stop_codon:yes gene_type:complete